MRFKIIIKRALLILIIFTCSNTIAQKDFVQFDHLSVEDGLSNNLIFKMLQDSLGFIWVATQDGLNRYDGYKFDVFHENDSYKTVIDSWISSLAKDNKGNIWYGTRTAGIGKIDFKTKKFISFEKLLRLKFGEDALNIQNLFVTKNGEILIGTWGAGLLIFNPSDSSFIQFKKNGNNLNSISQDKIYSVYKDSKGFIWAGSHRKGLNKINIQTGNISHFNFPGKGDKLISNNFIISILEDHLGDIWIGTYSNGLYKIPKGKGKPIRFNEKYGMTGTAISCIFEDSKNNLWVSTNGSGIFRFLRDKNHFINYNKNDKNIRGLQTNRVWTIIEDQKGLIWFGTLSYGINIYDPLKNNFKRISYNKNGFNSIIKDYVKSITIDSNNRKWIGTSDGISIIYPNGKIKILNKKNGLTVNKVRSIYERKNKNFWIATWGGGINIYNPRTGKFKYLLNNQKDSNSLADNYLRCIKEYKGNIYVGSESGLSKYIPQSNNFKRYELGIKITSTKENAQITNIFVDSKDNFWVGTNIGLYLFNVEKESFKKIDIPRANEIHQRNRIRALFEDSKGNLWIGTLGAGFANYDYQNNKFIFYTTKEGLSNNSVNEILEDENNLLWISTNFGLNAFDYRTQKFYTFKATDGLPNNEFNGGAAFKDSEGLLYFGSVKGLTYFDPNSFDFDKKAPKIAITDFKVNNKEFNQKIFINGLNKITLPYNQNFINISFSTLDYSAPKENKYRYKLLGLNENWVFNNNKNSVAFTNLAHGEYILKIQGANRFGFWNNKSKSLRIIIMPPFWDTTFARIFYILVFIAIVFTIYRIRIINLNKKKKHLEQLVMKRTAELRKNKIELENTIAAKDRMFSIIAHDVKNPFVALLGFSQMMSQSFDTLSEEEKKHSADSIYNSSRSIFSLLQNLLDWARLQMNKIDISFSKLNISEHINNIIKIYSVSASLKKITIQTILDENICIYADENIIETIFRNIISNAIKFTNEGGHILISSQILENMVHISVNDDGIGMEEKILKQLQKKSDSHFSNVGTNNEKGTGLGIILIKDFVNKNKGNFDIQSTPGQGTTITVSFPLYKDL